MASSPKNKDRRQRGSRRYVPSGPRLTNHEVAVMVAAQLAEQARLMASAEGQDSEDGGDSVRPRAVATSADEASGSTEEKHKSRFTTLLNSEHQDLEGDAHVEMLDVEATSDDEDPLLGGQWAFRTYSNENRTQDLELRRGHGYSTARVSVFVTTIRTASWSRIMVSGPCEATPTMVVPSVSSCTDVREIRILRQALQPTNQVDPVDSRPPQHEALEDPEQTDSMTEQPAGNNLLPDTPHDIPTELNGPQDLNTLDTYKVIDGLATLPATVAELGPIMEDLVQLSMVHYKDLTWLDDEIKCDEAATLVPTDSATYKYGGQVVHIDLGEYVMVCDDSVCHTCFPKTPSSFSDIQGPTEAQDGPWFHRNDSELRYTSFEIGHDVWIFGYERVQKYSGPRSATPLQPVKAKIRDNVVRDCWMCVGKKCEECKGAIVPFRHL
ncbi:uncharacterized protein CLAFUR5_05344 [Fulvia fulva]|uniref:Uncharacterized protein n=1 Tax=Passalora fulva TaxID=5499 RepID=A0A9Q8P880_PASFU|nr:uncharacterized protein CLAFUR5_05344 [Fulvia fulva]KAK4617064.1 hypothetical protein CLAFUR0_10741 [Fulvia fulva]UJO16828.1 hypothetical protein CLAFUR5_05344 [Fulvia fulva]